MSERLTRARALLLAEDAAGLAGLLDAHPELVAERWPDPDPHYEGYFFRATLLHHVPANPLIDGVPSNAVELATLLIERGAEVDAVTEAGPAQPTDVGWTALGLAATSSVAREAGVQRELIELLVERGADLDARNGGPLMGALYYGEEQAAAQLVELGAEVDFVAAAGLGLREQFEACVAADGSLAAHAHRLVHYSQIPLPEHESRDDILGLALCYAVKFGRLGIAQRLLELGANVNARPPFDHRATALFWAVLGEQPASIRWLLARGADRSLRDTTYDATACGWAEHLGRPACVAAFD